MDAVAKSVIVALSLGFAAAIIFGIGMIGPLTPSEGHPTLLVWLVFSFVPLLLTLVGTVVASLASLYPVCRVHRPAGDLVTRSGQRLDCAVANSE